MTGQVLAGRVLAGRVLAGRVLAGRVLAFGPAVDSTSAHSRARTTPALTTRRAITDPNRSG